MSDLSTAVEKHVHLSAECASRLGRLAQAHQTSEDQIMEKALTILFQLSDLVDDGPERREWSLLSESALRRVWDNDEDAAYDNWKDLYGISTR